MQQIKYKFDSVIEKKYKSINKHKPIIFNELTLEIQDIGCNANCFYCYQYQTAVIKESKLDAAKILKQVIQHIPETITNISILGGELKVLSLENQLKLINLINELKKKYYTTLLVNDTKLDSPLMRIEGIEFCIHIINWKNKNLLELDKKLNEIDSAFYYKVVITDNDTEEEIDNFLDINKEIRDRITFNIDISSENINVNIKNFNKVDNSKINSLDIKQEIYFCARKGDINLNINYSNKGIDLYYCCGGRGRKEFSSLKDLLNYLDEIKNKETEIIKYEDCKKCSSFRN